MIKKTAIFKLRRWYKLSWFLILFLLFTGVPRQSAAQSFPTRTPTPGPATNTPVPPPPTHTPQPVQPTNTPGPGQPTNTPTVAQPGLTATPASGSPTATPPGSQTQPMTTAEPCSLSPTLQALRVVNVRQGPGNDYPLLDQLAVGEVRPLLGRTASARWWYIELDTDEMGWVLNATTAVAVQGYTGLLPIIDAPSIGGNTPTPGPTWQPTPNPNCTVTPTATPTTTATATATTDATRDTTAAQITVGEAEALDAPPDLPQTAVTQSDDAGPTAVTPTADPVSGSAATPAPLVSDPVSSSNNWLPLVGLVLILSGIAAAFVLRRW